jgi:hypothetical protein
MPWWIFPKPETTMEKLNQDFREFIALLEKHAIEYLIVGGYAVAFHGFPRYTGDIDFFVAVSESNATGLLAVFDEFGFGNIGIEKADFQEPDFVIEIGREPRKIQVLTGIDGVTFEECRQHGITAMYGGMSLRFIGIEELIKNKQAAARDKDLIDVHALKELHGKD